MIHQNVRTFYCVCKGGLIFFSFTYCRYCLFDFPAQAPQEGTNEPSMIALDRLVLMTWCPEGAKVKQKMLYASSYDALKKALVGVYKYVQACDFEELSQEAIEEALKKK